MRFFLKQVGGKYRACFVSCSLALLVHTAPSHADQAYWEYEMQSGDSIWKIAHEMLTDWHTWQEITQLNQVQNDRLMAAGTVLRIPRTWVNMQDAPIALLNITGDVTRQKRGSGLIETLATTTALLPGDRLITGDNSSALIEFEDHSKVLLTPNSELVIQHSSVVGVKHQIIDISIELKAGEAEIKANPHKSHRSRFVIETPSAFATTRGTVYRVHTDEATTAAEVTQGRIEVGNTASTRSLPENYGIIAKKNMPIAPPKKLLTAPNIPPIGDVRYLPSTLSWPALQGAIAYRSQISTTSSFDSLIRDTQGRTQRTQIPASLPDGTYWLRVKGIDESGLQGHSSLTQFTVDARPFPPVIQQPRSKDTLYAGRTTFRWTEPEGVTQYRFELSTTPSFTAPVITTDTKDTSYIAADLAAGHYYWRVTSLSGQGKLGPAGYTTEIHVKPAPKTPELSKPALNTHQIHLVWPADPYTQTYQLQMATDQTFNNLVADMRLSSAEADINKPEPGHYYIRVRGFNEEDYAGEWTHPQKVDVPIENFLPMIMWGIFSIAIFL